MDFSPLGFDKNGFLIFLTSYVKTNQQRDVTISISDLKYHNRQFCQSLISVSMQNQIAAFISSKNFTDVLFIPVQ